MQYIISKKIMVAFIPFILCITTISSLQAASYNTKTGELFLPSLENGSQTLTDVTIKLKPDGTYAIQSGTESALPFRCSGLFSQATLDLLNSQATLNTPEKINSLLGCRWISESKTVSGASTHIPEILTESYNWVDANCSSLNAGFSDALEGGAVLTISQSIGSCSTSYKIHPPYDLKSKLFAVGSVRIDDNITATEVLIKFSADHKYELVSFALSTLDSPPLICESLKEADFSAISLPINPEEINDLLNCHWYQKITSSAIADFASYIWQDHECNSILVNSPPASAKSFSLNHSSGCGSIAAH